MADLNRYYFIDREAIEQDLKTDFDKMIASIAEILGRYNLTLNQRLNILIGYVNDNNIEIQKEEGMIIFAGIEYYLKYFEDDKYDKQITELYDWLNDREVDFINRYNIIKFKEEEDEKDNSEYNEDNENIEVD